MNREDLAETLERAIDTSRVEAAGSEVDELLGIVGELRLLPSREFEEHVRADLLEQAETVPEATTESMSGYSELMTKPVRSNVFEQWELGIIPADPRSFFFSFLSHAAVVVLIASGIWIGHGTIIKPHPSPDNLTYFPLPPGDTVPHGGGSGGDRSPIQASHGTPPRFSEEQLAPPAIVVRNPITKLQVDPTVLGPPELKLPQSNQMGDILSANASIPSNGFGATGGIGNHSGGGDGTGMGPGVGVGSGGGCCTDPFRPGKGVSAPYAIYDPNPEYSDEARKAKYQGIVVLAVVVDPSGHARDIRIARSLGMGLDEKAVEAVQKWKFTPGMKDGVPVAVRVNIEVNFRLY